MIECVFEFIKKTMRKNKLLLKKDFLNQRTKILKKSKNKKEIFFVLLKNKGIMFSAMVE